MAPAPVMFIVEADGFEPETTIAARNIKGIRSHTGTIGDAGPPSTINNP